MSLSIEDTIVDPDRQDAIPPVADVEYPCEVCGKESGPYKGRGRKPKRCPEHKRGGASGSTSGNARTRGSSAVLAGQAVDALCQLNSFAGIGLMMTGYHATASALAEREEAFREQAYAALVTDPALCRMILRAGTTSGKVSLIIAYAMLGAGVAPTAIMEYKMKQMSNASGEGED